MKTENTTAPAGRLFSFFTLISLLVLVSFPAAAADSFYTAITVIDHQTGKPVADAELRFVNYITQTREFEEEVYKTSSRGSCIVTSLEEYPFNLKLEVSAVEYITRTYTWINDPYSRNRALVGAFPADFTIKIDKPVTIGGSLENEYGDRINGALVKISSYEDDGRIKSSLEGNEVFTDINGRWTCECVHRYPQNIFLDFEYPGYATEKVEIRGDRTAFYDLRNLEHTQVFKFGYVISGSVLDNGNNPIENARVHYDTSRQGRAMSLNPFVLTDEEGRFSLPGIRVGYARLEVEAEGYVPDSRLIEVDVENEEQVFYLTGGGKIRGRVINKHRMPVKDVRVLARKSNYSGELLLDTKTDKDGFFEWTSAPLDGAFYSFHHERYEFAHKDLKPGRKTHEVLLSDAMIISGNVFDRESMEPITEFSVIQGYKMSDVKEEVISWAYERKLKIKDKRGRFTYAPTPIPQFYLRLEAEGYKPLISRKLNVEDGSVDLHFAMHQRPDSEKRTFTGKITDKDTGNGIPEVKVVLLDTENQKIEQSTYISWLENNYASRETYTDHDGFFRIDSVFYKDCAVFLKKEGYSVDVIRDVDISRPFNHRLPRGAAITGNVTDYYDSPLVDVPVTCTLLNSIDISFKDVLSDKYGRFRISNLPSGRYKVEFRAENVFRAHIAEVKEGDVYVVDWNKPSGFDLYGQVSISGQSVSDVRIAASSRAGGISLITCNSKPDGSYHLPLPEAGEYEISFLNFAPVEERQVNVKKSVVIEPGENQLDIKVGASISGLIDMDGDIPPSPSAFVFAYRKTPSDGQSGRDWREQYIEPQWVITASSTPDQSKRFTFRNIDEGEWLIAYWAKDMLTRDGQYTPARPVKLAKNDQKVIVLTIPKTAPLRVKARDMDTRLSIEPGELKCVDEAGFVFKSRMLLIPPGNSESEPDIDADGWYVFGPLPAGRYQLFSGATKDYYESSTSFEVSAENVESGKPVDVIIEMMKGGRLVFRLADELKGRGFKNAWVGYRLTDPLSGQPVLENANGLYYGDIHEFDKDNFEETVLTLPEGTYLLDAVFRDGNNYERGGDSVNIWNNVSRITIEKGRDTIVNISSR